MHADSEQDVFEAIVRGVAQSGVRMANERAVLTLIAGIPGVSNADIARRSGLGPQTTARILSDLEARGLIIRGQVLRGRRGQPATPYCLNAEGGYGLGIEIGWNHIELLLQDLAGHRIVTVRRPHQPSKGPQATLSLILAELDQLLQGATEAQRQRLVGIGIASPSLSPALLRHMAVPDPAIEAWSSFDMSGQIAGATNLPTLRFDSGSAAGWFEMLELTPPRPPGVAVFFIGSLVGGGLIINGDLHEGARRFAGDLGAMLVAGPDGTPAPLHLVASLYALRLKLEACGQNPGEVPPTLWNWDAIEPHAIAWIEDAAFALAQAAITLAATAEIDIAVINADMPPALLHRLVNRTQHHLTALPTFVDRVPAISAGQGGASSPAQGAARLVLFRSHFSRAWDLFEGDLGK